MIFVDKFTLQFVDPCFPSTPCLLKAPLPGLQEVQGFGAVRSEKRKEVEGCLVHAVNLP